MTAKQLADVLGLKIYTGEELADNRELKGCFIGDLLSLAMSKTEADNVWITIQTNVNIVAVASLTDCGCIVIAEGFCPEDAAVKTAEVQDVVVMGSELSAYEIAKKLAELGI